MGASPVKNTKKSQMAQRFKYPFDDEEMLVKGRKIPRHDENASCKAPILRPKRLVGIFHKEPLPTEQAQSVHSGGTTETPSALTGVGKDLNSLNPRRGSQPVGRNAWDAVDGRH